MDVQVAVAVGVPLVGALGGGFIWLLRLEGRVNTQQVQHKELREDVKYIRDRIDRALNGRHE